MEKETKNREERTIYTYIRALKSVVKLYERREEEAKSKHKREILQNASSLLQYFIYLVTRAKRIKNEIKL